MHANSTHVGTDRHIQRVAAAAIAFALTLGAAFVGAVATAPASFAADKGSWSVLLQSPEVTAAGDATVWLVPWQLLLALPIIGSAIISGRRWSVSRRTPELVPTGGSVGAAGTPRPSLVAFARPRRSLRGRCLRLRLGQGATAQASTARASAVPLRRWFTALMTAVLPATTMVAGISASVLIAGSAYAADPVPAGQSLTVTPAVGPVGTETLAVGTNWPKNSPVVVSTCGNSALNGDSDCDTLGGVSGTTSAEGTFTFKTSFTRPPKPCPCVMFAHATATQTVNRIPIELIGVPVATPSASGGTRALSIESGVEGSGPPSSWLGAAASRELVMKVTNTGQLGVDSPPTVVTLGKGEDPTDLLAQADLGAIAPGQTVEVRVPFELPALSFGSYTLKTTVGGLDATTTDRASASTYPWLLLVVAWLLIQIPLLGLHKRREYDDEPDTSGLRQLDHPFRSLVGVAAVGALAEPPPSGTDDYSSATPDLAQSATVSGNAGTTIAGTTVAGTTVAGTTVAGTALLERPTASDAVEPELRYLLPLAAATVTSTNTVPSAASTASTGDAMPAWAAAALVDLRTPDSSPVTAFGAPSAVAAVAAVLVPVPDITDQGALAWHAEPGAVSAALYGSSSLTRTYGVGHVRRHIDPEGATSQVPIAVATRIVIGGVVPRR